MSGSAFSVVSAESRGRDAELSVVAYLMQCSIEREQQGREREKSKASNRRSIHGVIMVGVLVVDVESGESQVWGFVTACSKIVSLSEKALSGRGRSKPSIHLSIRFGREIN